MPKSFKIFLITLILFIPFGYSGAQDFQCAPDQFFDFIMIEEEDGVRLVSPSRSDQIMVKAKSVTDIARKLTYPNPSIDCKELLKAKSCLSELKFYKAWASLTYLDSNLKGGMSPYQSGGLLEFYEDFHFYLAKDPNSELFKTALTKNVKKLTADYIKEDQENFINGFISGCKENNLKYYMLENNKLMQSIIRIKKLNSRFIDIFRNLAADGGQWNELFSSEFEDTLVKIVASYKAQSNLSSLYYALIFNLQKQFNYCESR